MYVCMYVYAINEYWDHRVIYTPKEVVWDVFTTLEEHTLAQTNKTNHLSSAVGHMDMFRALNDKEDKFSHFYS
jgi:hypothetical protein